MSGEIDRFLKEWMTAKDACQALRCSKSTLDRRIKSEAVIGRNVGGRTYVNRKSVERYLKACLEVA